MKTDQEQPAKTPVDTPYLLPVEKATQNVFGPYMVYPNRPSTAPDYLTLSNYIKGTELTATVLKEISEM